METSNKKQFAEDLKHPPSSSDEYITDEHIDNKYTTTEEEQEDEERDRQQMFFGGTNNLEDESNMSKRSYKGNFNAAKEEEAYGCPYGACGRKFVSAG